MQPFDSYWSQRWQCAVNFPFHWQCHLSGPLVSWSGQPRRLHGQSAFAWLSSWSRSARGWQAPGLSQGRMWEGQSLPEPCLQRPAPAQSVMEKSHGKTLALIISGSLLHLLKCTALDSNVLLTVSLSKYHSSTLFKCFLGIQNNFLYVALAKSEVLCWATKGHKFTTASINTETNKHHKQ